MRDPLDRGDRRDPKTAPGCPRSDVLEGGRTPTPLFATRMVPEVITPLNISARSKTMWTLPPLWTHSTRPQGFGNLAKNARFPQRPHRPSVSLTKTKNEEHNHSDQLSTESDHPKPLFHSLDALPPPPHPPSLPLLSPRARSRSGSATGS